MFLVLFHAFYFFGKYVYDSYFSQKIEDVKVPQITSKGCCYTMDPDTLADNEPTNIRFHPPVYIQRYNRIIEILTSDKYKGKIRKVVDFGCAELNFFLHLKSIPELEEILCVDINRSVLEANKGKVVPLVTDHIHPRSKPLVVHVYEGSLTSNDKKLEKTDAVICIELIEHLYPDTLTDFPFNIFGCVKPKVAIVTTPNAEFNVLFNNFSGFRNYDHKFEWTREQFQDWARNIVLRYSDYQVTFIGIGNGPKGTDHLGASTQMAIFHRNYEERGSELLYADNLFKLVTSQNFPFKIDNRSDEQKILDEVIYHTNRSINFDNLQGELSLRTLLSLLSQFNVTMESLKAILEERGWSIVDRGEGPVTFMPEQSNTIENNFLDDNFSYEESETSVDYNGYTNSEDFNDSWPSENWDEEPSVVIPQNNSIIQHSNTYLYDAELLNINNPSDRANFHEFSVDLSSNSISQHSDASLLKINSYVSSDSDTACYSNAHHDNNTFIKPTGKVHRTLDFQHPISVLSNSISPQPLLVHMDQLNSSYRDDTVIDKNMLCSSLLNNTFHSLDIPRDESIDFEKAATSYCMHFNTSLNRKVLESANYYYQNETDECYEGSVTELERVSAEKKNIDYEDHFVFEDCASASSTNQPQYTSSPRVVAKTKESSFSHKSSDVANVSNGNISKTLQLVDQRIPSNDVVSICQSSLKDFDNTNVSIVSNLSTTDSYNTLTKCDTTKSELIIWSKKDDVENISSDNITSNNDISVEMSNLNSKILTSERDRAIITQESNIKAVDNSNENKRKLFSVKTYSPPLTYPSTTDTPRKENTVTSFQFTSIPSTDKSGKEKCTCLPCAKENSDLILHFEEAENVNSIQSETCLISTVAECKESLNSFIAKGIKCRGDIVEIKTNSPDHLLESPPNSWSPEIMDSGYPNTASAQDMTPEYDLSSIGHDQQISDSESPSVAEAPRLAYPEPVIIENGDLANNNRDGEGNNMMAVADDIENLQPFINVLENDLENENDIYIVENGFPVWLLRILEMANPIDIDGHGELVPFDFIEDGAEYLGIDHDEGFDRDSSIGDSDRNNDEISSNITDTNDIDYNNEVMHDTDSDDDKS